MTIVVDWLVENRVIIWEATGNLTNDEMECGNIRVQNLIAQAQQNQVEKVHVFVDVFRVRYRPMSYYAMYHWLTYLQEDGYGWHVICASTSQVMTRCTEFAFKYINGQSVVHNDIVAGLLFLQDKDQTLPDLLKAYRAWVRMPYHSPCSRAS